MILLNILIMHSLGSVLQAFKRQRCAFALAGCSFAEIIQVMALLLIRPCLKKKKKRVPLPPSSPSQISFISYTDLEARTRPQHYMSTFVTLIYEFLNSKNLTLSMASGSPKSLILSREGTFRIKIGVLCCFVLFFFFTWRLIWDKQCSHAICFFLCNFKAFLSMPWFCST